MNIVIDIRCLLHKPYTGVAEYTINLLNHLFQTDHKNQFFLFFNAWRGRKKDLPVFNYPNVQIVDFHWPNKIFNLCLKIFHWPKIDKLIEKRTREKIDVFFMPDLNFVACSKRVRKKITAHDLSFEIYQDFFNLKQKLWYFLINPKKVFKEFDEIIAVSENTKNDLVNIYQIPPEKIIVENPRLDLTFRKLTSGDPQLPAMKKKYSLPENFILYLGALEPRKNVTTLIAAFHQLITSCSTDVDLMIAGQGPEMEKLKKMAVASRLLRERIKFLGYILPEERCALYNLAKVFVFPSFYEGFGYPVAEALACGTAVITSYNSSLTEINNEKIIFIDPYNINELAEAIKTVLAPNNVLTH